MPNEVAIDLEEFDTNEGYILKMRIDQQGGTEVGPILVRPLPGFLRSVEIMH